MNRKEFSMWQTVTASSAYRWTEDEIVRLNGRGVRYYQGGKDGVYMEITPEGRLTAGTYEGAIPHIGEAFFTPKASKDCESFDTALQLACEVGGRQFLIDMFTGDRPQQPVTAVEQKDHQPAPAVLGGQTQETGTDKPIVARLIFPGDSMEFNDPDAFLAQFRESVDCRGLNGVKYELFSNDPSLRKSVDDLLWGEFGEDNPHPLSYYEQDQGMTMGGLS